MNYNYINKIIYFLIIYIFASVIILISGSSKFLTSSFLIGCLRNEYQSSEIQMHHLNNINKNKIIYHFKKCNGFKSLDFLDKENIIKISYNNSMSKSLNYEKILIDLGHKITYN